MSPPERLMFVEHWRQALVLTVFRGREGRVVDVAILSSSGMAPPVLGREGSLAGGSPKGAGQLAWPRGDLQLGTSQGEISVCAKDAGLFRTEEAPADTKTGLNWAN